MTKNIKKAWRQINFWSQLKAIFSYKKDVEKTELRLRGLIRFLQEIEDKDFSEPEIQNFEKKAEQARKEALAEKNDAVKWWKGIVASLLLPIIGSVWKHIDTNTTVIQGNVAIGIYIIACIGIVLVTFHQMRTVALKGRLISLANSALYQIEVLKGFSLHYDQVEKDCVYNVSNVTRFFPSVTRQNLKQMLSIIIIAISVIAFIGNYKWNNLVQLWQYIIS